MNNKYQSFLKEIRSFIPEERIYTDEVRRLAWGTDAGFYRLIPEIVIRSDTENEISRILTLANPHISPSLSELQEPAFPDKPSAILF